MVAIVLKHYNTYIILHYYITLLWYFATCTVYRFSPCTLGCSLFVHVDLPKTLYSGRSVRGVWIIEWVLHSVVVYASVYQGLSTKQITRMSTFQYTCQEICLWNKLSGHLVRSVHIVEVSTLHGVRKTRLNFHCNKIINNPGMLKGHICTSI